MPLRHVTAEGLLVCAGTSKLSFKAAIFQALANSQASSVSKAATSAMICLVSQLVLLFIIYFSFFIG